MVTVVYHGPRSHSDFQGEKTGRSQKNNYCRLIRRLLEYCDYDNGLFELTVGGHLIERQKSLPSIQIGEERTSGILISVKIGGSVCRKFWLSPPVTATGTTIGQFAEMLRNRVDGFNRGLRRLGVKRTIREGIQEEEREMAEEGVIEDTTVQLPVSLESITSALEEIIREFTPSVKQPEGFFPSSAIDALILERFHSFGEQENEALKLLEAGVSRLVETGVIEDFRPINASRGIDRRHIRLIEPGRPVRLSLKAAYLAANLVEEWDGLKGQIGRRVLAGRFGWTDGTVNSLVQALLSRQCLINLSGSGHKRPTYEVAASAIIVYEPHWQLEKFGLYDLKRSAERKQIIRRGIVKFGRPAAAISAGSSQAGFDTSGWPAWLVELARLLPTMADECAAFKNEAAQYESRRAEFEASLARIEKMIELAKEDPALEDQAVALSHRYAELKRQRDAVVPANSPAKQRHDGLMAAAAEAVAKIEPLLSQRTG